jgi:hypothetical protein
MMGILAKKIRRQDTAVPIRPMDIVMKRADGCKRKVEKESTYSNSQRNKETKTQIQKAWTGVSGLGRVKHKLAQREIVIELY